MALNFQILKTRALTALIFVIVMLTGLLWNSWSFLILFTIIHFGAWSEYVKLLKKIDSKKYVLYCLTGLIYITLPYLLLVDLRSGGNIFNGSFKFTQSGKLIPCTILISIWINDSSAYLVGSLIGKTHFSKISPKKTLEGTIGGLLLCVLTIALLAYYTTMIVVKDAVVIAAICAILGTAGDLLESKLKRMANVKDSGSFMPGHGGFLDRFDSFLIATPFVWLYLNLFV